MKKLIKTKMQKEITLPTKQPKAKRDRKVSERVALMITEIFGLIEALTEEDIAYLRDTTKIIEEESGKLHAVGGILVDLDKADAKIALGNQAKRRIDGIITIWNALRDTPKIQSNFVAKQIQRRSIDEMFGL